MFCAAHFNLWNGVLFVRIKHCWIIKLGWLGVGDSYICKKKNRGEQTKTQSGLDLCVIWNQEGLFYYHYDSRDNMIYLGQAETLQVPVLYQWPITSFVSLAVQACGIKLYWIAGM